IPHRSCLRLVKPVKLTIKEIQLRHKLYFFNLFASMTLCGHLSGVSPGKRPWCHRKGYAKPK
ncbi:hypothetical protein EMPG_11145, partial [Blastomyces silverae]